MVGGGGDAGHSLWHGGALAGVQGSSQVYLLVVTCHLATWSRAWRQRRERRSEVVFFPEDSTSLFQPGSEGVREGSGVGRLVAELRGVRSTLDLALFLLTCKQLTQEVIRWVSWRQRSTEGEI